MKFTLRVGTSQKTVTVLSENDEQPPYFLMLADRVLCRSLRVRLLSGEGGICMIL